MSRELDPLIFDEMLFDARLRRDAAAAEARMADQNLQPQNHELREAFQALETLDAGQARPPGNLAGRVMSRIRAAEALHAPSLRLRPADVSAGDNPRVIQLHGLRDIVAVAAMIVLAVGIGVPGLVQMQHRENRIVCASNLARIGQGFSAYAAIFDGQLPFTGFEASASWSPASDPTVRVKPNRVHLYPLVASRHVENPRFFVCPASQGDVPLAGGAPRAGGFVEARNVSYAYQNMAGMRPRVDASLASLPILGDDNPLFDNGMPLLESYSQRLGLLDAAEGNSRAHGGSGQNVLTVDGSAKWFSTPRVGVQGDNIWTLDGVDRYTGREGPRAMTDAHLIK